MTNTALDTHQRVIVEHVRPSVDGGRYPAKRVLGQQVEIEVDLVADSHDQLAGRVFYRKCGSASWQAVPLRFLVNDRYGAAFEVDALGRWEFRVEGWVDELASWSQVLERKRAGGEEQDLVSHLRQGSRLMQGYQERVPPADQPRWREAQRVLDAADTDLAAALALVPSLIAPRPGPSPQLAAEGVTMSDAGDAGALAAGGLFALVSDRPDPRKVSQLDQTFQLEVERPRAEFAAWYEFFPRSCGQPGQHGTFRDCEARLEYIAGMGFDVIYLPPIHPIGTSFRKGRNNSLSAAPGDHGSPWAIGAAEGGHKSIHPALGTLDDFRWFVKRAGELGLEVALDVALQVSPDHPYVTEHPEWFVRRPDGTIQYAENPPKKYQDIYPFDFQCEAAAELWQELLSIFQFWIGEGIRTFRVDNPHTKSLPFWRFCVAELKREHPDVILLAEAFTRPKLMYSLAKLGFSQSYTYFTWRNSKSELIEYFTELTQTEVADFFRPNLWPNTPDILPENLQYGGRPAFMIRLILAGTLGSAYGIYGPAFELMDAEPRPGSGEYIDNEKYELKQWPVDRPDSLAPVIRRLNHIRRENLALQSLATLRFHGTDNDALLCYSKADGDNVIIVVISLDPHYQQSGFVDLNFAAIGMAADHGSFQVHDLLGGGRFLWNGSRNYVELNPSQSPAHIFRIRRRLQTEHDFDYFV